MSTAMESPLYHVTLLSNFARAYDKYRREYRKGAITESRYPSEFYLLPQAQLAVGVDKAARLLQRSGLAGDELLVLETRLPPERLRPNLRNGLGLVWPSPDLPLHGLHRLDARNGLGGALGLEETMARSLALHAAGFAPYARLRPRSVSFLPLARGCDAACPFCFSEASVSSEQAQGALDEATVQHWLQRALRAGAERAVITGGGEPLLWPWERLLGLVRNCGAVFDKLVLISNGLRLARLDPPQRRARLAALGKAGLSVLALSRHHPDEAQNAHLMRLETHTPALLESLAALGGAAPAPRLVCVLQQGGVDSVEGVEHYVHWAAAHGAAEVCFKELYVSTSQESVYHAKESNAWSAAHQAPLSLVHEWALARGWTEVSCLPWGAPVYAGRVEGVALRVAAYTEPSLYWERRHGLARSWNVMADGSCLASLEDRASRIEPELEPA
jgi:hypothetical protein